MFGVRGGLGGYVGDILGEVIYVFFVFFLSNFFLVRRYFGEFCFG